MNIPDFITINFFIDFSRFFNKIIWIFLLYYNYETKDSLYISIFFVLYIFYKFVKTKTINLG
jgi:hypothetical protein